MAKTWYPMNFSGLYVNGKYYKLTSIHVAIGLHYKDRPFTCWWENKRNWTRIDPTSFQAGFWRICELRLGSA